MHIESIMPIKNTGFTSIEQVKRSEPAVIVTDSPMIDYQVEKENLKSKIKYNWKTISAVTGATALVLLGILKRHSISKFFSKKL